MHPTAEQLTTKKQEYLPLVLYGSDGNPHSLAECKNKRIVIYFYPKDQTYGCSIQSKAYSMLNQEFAALNTIVFGISGGDETHKQKFVQSCNLKQILLADEQFEMCDLFSVGGFKKILKLRFYKIERSSFIIDEKGDVIKANYGVPYAEDAQLNLDFIKNLTPVTNSVHKHKK